MKSLYYRSQKISSHSLVALACASVLTLMAVHLFPSLAKSPQSDVMLAAARQTDAAFHAIQCRRLEMGHEILESQDPFGSGLIGPSMSMVTTLPGHLSAKQTSINPNFAAVVVRYLTDAGAQPGDRVAIGCTGSFPAINIAVIAAVEAMELEPTMVSSAASSQYGANDPEMMWPDIEKALHEEGLIRTRSVAISRGGFLDKAAGMTRDTRKLLDGAIHRSGIAMLRERDIDDAIGHRMEIYSKAAGDRRFVAYINVGGGYASVGGTEGNEISGSGLIKPGNFSFPGDEYDSVAIRFLKNDVPVINMINLVSMARRSGLPVAPLQRPQVGEGAIYQSGRSRQLGAITGILFILAATTFVVRPPSRFTTWQIRNGKIYTADTEPRWMV